ncbi:MAG: DUF296 domain-containing protein [Chloroflexota bacterium]|nr:DUF296 domain-containing protein [Chloroflexota bacterium]
MSDGIYQAVRTFFVQPERDSEFLSFLARIARENGITTGSFTAIGALRSAKLAFYDQDTREYVDLADLRSPQELISCMGAITTSGGEPDVHAHVVLVDSRGATSSGHLVEGKVFFSQVTLVQLTPAGQ